MPVSGAMAGDQEMPKLVADRKPSALRGGSLRQDNFTPGLVGMHDEHRGKRAYGLFVNVGDVEPTAEILDSEGQGQIGV